MVTGTLGIDLGGSFIKAVVVADDGSIREQAMEPSLVTQGPEPTLERIVALVRRMREEHSFHSIGIGICGPVNHAEGMVVTSPILPGWDDVPVVEPLADELSAPVRLENDAACAMLGEWWQGAGERMPVVAGLTLGTGIGGGLVVDGNVFHGDGSWGAEFGHVAVADDPPCPCGGRGCVNCLASVTATLDRYREASGEEIGGFEELLNRLAAGDGRAREALDASVGYLSRAVRALLNALNPSVFVLAGGMAQWGEPLAEAVRDEIAHTTFAGLDRTPIRVARLGLFSGAVGAARLASP